MTATVLDQHCKASDTERLVMQDRRNAQVANYRMFGLVLHLITPQNVSEDLEPAAAKQADN